MVQHHVSIKPRSRVTEGYVSVVTHINTFHLQAFTDWRQIGFGIMGLADCLVKLGNKYGSEEAIDISNEIGETMINQSVVSSERMPTHHFTTTHHAVYPMEMGMHE